MEMLDFQVLSSHGLTQPHLVLDMTGQAFQFLYNHDNNSGARQSGSESIKLRALEGVMVTYKKGKKISTLIPYYLIVTINNRYNSSTFDSTGLQQYLHATHKLTPHFVWGVPLQPGQPDYYCRIKVYKTQKRLDNN